MLIRNLILLAGLIGCNSDHGLSEIAETYGLQAGDSVDILMVVDTSCSMSDDYQSVYYGLAQTAIDIRDLDADWTLGVMSASPGDNFVIEVDPTDPDPGWAVMEAMDEVNDLGGETEEGFAAALENTWFVRNNVDTLIFFVSDEKEQSNLPAHYFRDQWPNHMYAVSIVGPATEQSLSYDEEGYCSAEVSPKYHNVADHYISICTEERWSAIGTYEQTL